MLIRGKNSRPDSGLLATLALAVSLIAAPVAVAQNLLKPGQGLVGAPQPIEEKPKEEDNTQLPQVDVEGKRDPLNEKDKKLREQKKKLPGLGSDGDRKRGTAEKVIDFYNGLEKDPNNLSPDTQRFLDQQVHSPDFNHRDDYVTLPRREGIDYVDPIEAQENAGSKKK